MSKPKVETPDYAKASENAVYTDLALLPERRLTEAAAKMGTGQFEGLGDADNAGVVADQMAAALLEIQKTYGSDYVKQRLAELQASDPEGQAARRKLYERIQAQIESPTDRPTAAALEKSVADETAKGASLDDATLREVQQSVRGAQAARNNVLGNAAAAQEATAVSDYGEKQQAGRQQAALNYLTSGVSPEDVEYRRMQQNMGNLGAFINGTTPEAQFKSLSNAGNGAAPFISSQMTTGVNNNAGQQGANNTLDAYRTQTNWAAQQANPYTAGLSTGIGAAGLYLSTTKPNPLTTGRNAPPG